MAFDAQTRLREATSMQLISGAAPEDGRRVVEVARGSRGERRSALVAFDHLQVVLGDEFRDVGSATWR